MDNAIELPAVGSAWSLDGLPVTVFGVKKKGRGYAVLWVGGDAKGRTRLKEWDRKAKAA